MSAYCEEASRSEPGKLKIARYDPTAGITMASLSRHCPSSRQCVIIPSTIRAITLGTHHTTTAWSFRRPKNSLMSIDIRKIVLKNHHLVQSTYHFVHMLGSILFLFPLFYGLFIFLSRILLKFSIVFQKGKRHTTYIRVSRCVSYFLVIFYLFYLFISFW